MSQDNKEGSSEFHDTVTRDITLDRAKIERYRDEQEARQQPRRDPWFRRAEDRAVFEANRKREFHDRLQKWVILIMLFVSILVGDAAMIQVMKALLLGG
jgi:hypothetical protein